MLAPTSKESVSLARLRLVALGVPAALLLGALASQYLGGLHPCDMCIWQRWPHGLAIVAALGAIAVRTNVSASRLMTGLAALLIAASGAIGVFHVGVEQGWWEGLTTCSSGSVTSMDDLLGAPLVRCDEIQWSLVGISLAGWNAIFSLGAAAFVLVKLGRARA